MPLPIKITHFSLRYAFANMSTVAESEHIVSCICTCMRLCFTASTSITSVVGQEVLQFKVVTTTAVPSAVLSGGIDDMLKKNTATSA